MSGKSAPFAPLLLSIIALMGISFLLVGCESPPFDPISFLPAPNKYEVKILRDQWGTPHIYGKTDADAAYGLAYAHCEDDWINIEDTILSARGELARKLGRDLVKFDYIAHLFKVVSFTEEHYASGISPELRAIVEAYAEGITHYAALHPDHMPYLRLPVTGKDIIAGVMIKAPFFYELQRSLEEMMSNSDIQLDEVGILALETLKNNPFSQDMPIGSNAWAVGPARSADGATRIAINSHMPWDGQLTWYEAHVHSEEGWDVIGATFPGGPFIFKGHNANMGWCHTINRPGLADIYELTLNPDDPDQYEFDGEWRFLEKQNAAIWIQVWKTISFPVFPELLWSVHGPAIRMGEKAYALRFVGYGDVDILEQWRFMNKAQNLDEFLAAMNRLTMLSFNTLYADRDGNLFYAYAGKIPKRSNNYDWTKLVPGNTSQTLWTDYYAFADLPQVLNPPSAFIQSCNSSPFHTTVGEGNPVEESFPAPMRIEKHYTNRSLRALTLYGGDDAITKEEFFTYKYDKEYDPESEIGLWLQEIKNAAEPEDPQMRSAWEILQAWDRKGTGESTGATLVMLANELPMDKEAPPEYSKPMKQLYTAVMYLLNTRGRIDVPWSEMLRLKRGSLDLPLAGCPDCLRAFDLGLQEDGHFAPTNGDCFFQMVEWDADGTMRSQSIHQYGSATSDADSPHYADQAPLFVAEQMRPTLYYEEDIRAHLLLEYYPGEFVDPWYKHTEPKQTEP